MSGNLYLVPTYLSEANDLEFVSPLIRDIVKNTSYYLVENVRFARRFISSLKTGIEIQELSFTILDKNSSSENIAQSLVPLRNGFDMAVMSEAGVPCLADPGNLAVSYAHANGIKVIPLPGASSIQMALISSGFNGQQFTFHGYLPIEKDQRINKIKELEKMSMKGYTQLFMETPYRNEQLFEDILKVCNGKTLLSIASDISGVNEQIKTKTIDQWKAESIRIHKIPSIFSFGQFP